LGAQEENGVLVLDVYSINVPSDVIHEKGFALWAKALKGGEQSSHEYVLEARLPVKHGQGIFPDSEKDVSYFGSAPEKVSVVFLCKWVEAQPGVVRINGRTA
jgi:hypothetical protein